MFAWSTITTILLGLSGAMMIFIILLQRGRGGGLAGAFGGLGGQSAFGTKAGDVFTKVTAGIAIIWVVLAGVAGFAMRSDAKEGFRQGANVAPEEPAMGAAAEDDASGTDENPESAAERDGTSNAEPASGEPLATESGTEEPNGSEE
jgi:preprotein translocase subunit SecG